jgi:hypothetical protein
MRGKASEYRGIALLGALADGKLGFFSFTSDGKRAEGRLADGSDIHTKAIAFEAQMPAGLARMVYWPLVECVIQAIVGSHFRASWAPVSDDRGQPFQMMVGAPATG